MNTLTIETQVGTDVTRRLVVERMLELTDPRRHPDCMVSYRDMGLQPRPLRPVAARGAMKLLIKEEQHHMLTSSAYDRAAVAATLGARSLRAENGDTDSSIIAATDNGFGLAVARAAAALGLPATIVCTKDVLTERRDSMRRAGASIFEGYHDLTEAMLVASELAQEKNGVLLHHANSTDVLAGYGTIGQEIATELGRGAPPSRIFVPTSHGGGALALGMDWALSRVLDHTTVEAATRFYNPHAVKPDSLISGLGASQRPPRVVATPYIRQAQELLAEQLDVAAVSVKGALATAAALEYMADCSKNGLPEQPEVLVAVVPHL